MLHFSPKKGIFDSQHFFSDSGWYSMLICGTWVCSRLSPHVMRSARVDLLGQVKMNWSSTMEIEWNRYGGDDGWWDVAVFFRTPQTSILAFLQWPRAWPNGCLMIWSTIIVKSSRISLVLIRSPKSFGGHADTPKNGTLLVNPLRV